MFNLEDSLTEIDWLNSLRIKKSDENKEETNILVQNTSQKLPEKTFSVNRLNGCDKPSYSYAYLIKLAIESSKNKRLKLNEIYAWIMEKYPYYKYRQTDNSKGWKNAIRHNLSLNKVFKRCAKNSSESGKGSYWTIDSTCGDDFIQNPPLKKMKTYYLYPGKERKVVTIISENQTTDNNDDLKILSAPEIKFTEPKSLHSQSDSPDLSISDTLINDSISSQSTFSTYTLKGHMDNKMNIFSNSFFDRSAFVPYTVHNNNTSTRSSDISSSTYEISYSRNSKYSSYLLQTPSVAYSNYSQTRSKNDWRFFRSNQNDRSSNAFDFLEILKPKQASDHLEIDGEAENGNEEIILKTPALSQINTSDFKDSSEETFTIKCPKVVNFNQESSETIFEINNFYDSFISIHQSLESETSDSKQFFTNIHSVPSEKISCQDISFSQNIVFSSRSHFNTLNFENHNLFEGSLGLSSNTKKILFNASGLRENYLSGSQWFSLSENNNQNEMDANDVSSNEFDASHTLHTYDSQTYTQEEIIPSNEFLEMKNHLRCYRFKDSSLSESNKPSSVSTSSTVKSTDTVNSKSPACDKRGDVMANNAINSNEVLLVINQVSKSHLSEEDDDIDDCFNWDNFV